MCIGGGQGAAGIFERLNECEKGRSPGPPPAPSPAQGAERPGPGVRSGQGVRPTRIFVCLQELIMATTTIAIPKTKGGAFLLETRAPEEIFTPEDFTAEHHAIAKTTEQFFNQEIAPHVNEINNQQHAVALQILRKSAELGLTAVVLPEKFGGMEMDLTSMMVVAEGVARNGSYSAWHGAHTGIGTLPMLLFGNEEQKKKYLPKLATAEMLAAYCLSEPQAGSRCAGGSHARRSDARRQALHPQRPENVDHQRRLCGPVHRVRESRRRKVHGVPGRTRVARRFARRGRTEDGDQGQLDHGRLSRQREGAGRKRAGRSRAAATSSRSTF